MKRTFGIILAFVAAAASLAGLSMSCWWPRTFPSQPQPRFTV